MFIFIDNQTKWYNDQANRLQEASKQMKNANVRVRLKKQLNALELASMAMQQLNAIIQIFGTNIKKQYDALTPEFESGGYTGDISTPKAKIPRHHIEYIPTPESNMMAHIERIKKIKDMNNDR